MKFTSMRRGNSVRIQLDTIAEHLPAICEWRRGYAMQPNQCSLKWPVSTVR